MCALAAVLGSALALGLLAPVPAAQAAPRTALYLVTLDSPGTAAGRTGPAVVGRLRLSLQQDAVLARVGAPAPTYRWTTALNGVAVELTPAQARELATVDRVAAVEQNAVRPLAGGAPATSDLATAGGARRGGAGVVLGMVDTGIDPENPLFADVPALGRGPEGFTGECQPGEDWETGTCSDKLAGARFFVEGFGADRVRSSADLSPRDDHGHGTQLASVAAGNAGVTVRAGRESLGRFASVAPQTRLAVYKACWTAPDPHDDGCATADLVTAVDRATADGVDVLNLSVGGPARADTLDRALLGAAEAGIVVVAAAGNGGADTFAAHPSPWVTTVGGTTGVARVGEVRLGDGPRLAGATAASRRVGPVRLVLAADVVAPGWSRAEARTCAPGSLDAGRVDGRVVLCERGRVARVGKSEAVARADGAGMVLVNTGPGSRNADLHDVPTVHLDAGDGRVVRRWARRHPAGTVTLAPLGKTRTAPRVVPWSSSGDPSAAVLKPDVVAPATGQLAAVPASVRAGRWDLVAGTSVASARTAGAAAVLLGRHDDWSAATVRSALATTATDAPGGSVLRSGAGRIRLEEAPRPGLAYDLEPAAYRAWLAGRRTSLNTPSVLLHAGQEVARRTVTNVGERTMYFSSSATGFRRHRVLVTPAALRLDPGESATWTMRVSGPAARPFDDGWVTWRGANGSVTRVPVLLTR